MMAPKIIAANWKMHKTFEEGLQLAKEIIHYLQDYPISNNQVILFPTFIHLEAINRLLLTTGVEVDLGAQNCHYESAGAFTGEIAVNMLASVGVSYVLVGHSERRQNFLESNDLIARKIDAILNCGLQPILCCGEALGIREKDQHYSFIRQQIAESLFHLNAKQIQQVKIAYEPVWAIGTGVVPNPLEVQNMQHEIRNILHMKYSSSIADNTTILYGGSCNAANASTFVNIPGINGLLIGGASLHLKEFLNILKSLSCN
jgi:triosephosphate isomerase